MTIIKIPAVARITDNGDGSSTARIYNDSAELLREFRAYKSENVCSDEELFHEDNPYENGYINLDITIEYNTETGRFKPFSVSGG